MSALAARFGKNLRRCRKQAGFSQETLAIRASLHRSEISLLERGERTPRVDTLARLAGGLGIDASALLDGMEWEPREATEGRFRLGKSE